MTTQSDQILMAIIGHLVGDYLFQVDWMAQNKKKHWLPCLTHCVVWTFWVWVFSGVGWPVALFLFACHYLQDGSHAVSWWMKFIGCSGFMNPPLAPWSLIVVDNVWHIVQIVIAVKFL